MAAGGEDRALGMRAAETITAIGFLALGAIVIFDSVRLGMGWKEDGPQAGYFPFYVGVIICAAALINLATALHRLKGGDRTFVEAGQLKLVLSMLVPSVAYVLLIGGIAGVGVRGLGIYVASALFIAFFMRWLGKYAWWKAAAVSVGNSVVFFLIFEVWFKIPLPKGPLESLLGLD